MLLKIPKTAKKTIEFLFKCRENFLPEWKGIRCYDCKRTTNYLREENEKYLQCPKCRVNINIELFEESAFESPDYGSTLAEIALFEEQMQYTFEYTPGEFPDDETEPKDINSIVW